MSVYTLHQEFNDLTWFHVNAMTIIADMPVTIRGAGKFSVRVTNPEVLEQSIGNPAEIERVRSILTDSFGEIVENLTVSNKSHILGMKEKFKTQLLQKAEPIFSGLGLEITKLTLDQLQPS